MLRIKYMLERTTKNTYCFVPVGATGAGEPAIFGKLWIGQDAFKGAPPKNIEVTIDTGDALVPVKAIVGQGQPA